MTFHVTRTEQDKTSGTGVKSDIRKWVVSSHDTLTGASAAEKAAEKAFQESTPNAKPWGHGTPSLPRYYSELLINYGSADSYGNVYRETRFYISSDRK